MKEVERSGSNVRIAVQLIADCTKQRKTPFPRSYISVFLNDKITDA